MSLDYQNPDFVPSIFPHTQTEQKAKAKTKRSQSCIPGPYPKPKMIRRRTPRRVHREDEKLNTKDGDPVDCGEERPGELASIEVTVIESKEDFQKLDLVMENQKDIQELAQVMENQEDNQEIDQVIKSVEDNQEINQVIKSEEDNQEIDQVIESEENNQANNQMISSDEDDPKLDQVIKIDDDESPRGPADPNIGFIKQFHPHVIPIEDEEELEGCFENGSQKDRAVEEQGEHSKTSGLLIEEANNTYVQRYICNLCWKTLECKEDFISHMTDHNVPATCGVCKQFFFDSNLFRTHKCPPANPAILPANYTKGVFACQLCGKNFASASAVNIHMRVHTGERPHKCPICGKGFTQKGNLQCHIRIHTGERPYKCDMCPKTFIQKINLTQHLNGHIKRRRMNSGMNSGKVKNTLPNNGTTGNMQDIIVVQVE